MSQKTHKYLQHMSDKDKCVSVGCLFKGVHELHTDETGRELGE